MLEPDYHTTKFFTVNLLVIKIKKTEIHMNKPAYFELSILELSKILMYEFSIFDTSNYVIDRPLSKGKHKKVLGLMKDTLSGKIMTKFVGLRAKREKL